MEKQQITYNRAIDNLTYLVLNYSKPVEELLAFHNVFFKGNPSKKQLINEVIEQIKSENQSFINSLEKLMIRFSGQENDQFWGVLAKGALGIVGGLLGKKKRRSSSSSNVGAASAQAAQAAAAKRDMERRMAQMRAQQERERREAERRRQEAEQRRLREEKQAKEKADAARKKTNMMLMIGGGVAVVGLVLVLVLKPKPQSQVPSYGQYMPPMPQVSPMPAIQR